MESVLEIIQVVIAVVVIFLVLLHSGKDTGLSGAFGIGQSGSAFGGGSLVERNLDRPIDAPVVNDEPLDLVDTVQLARQLPQSNRLKRRLRQLPMS